jgi:aquaporin TIP
MAQTKTPHQQVTDKDWAAKARDFFGDHEASGDDNGGIGAKCLAEFIGTFTLVFIGSGAICVATLPETGLGLLGVALAHGLALGVMISAVGHISGGHINPAVTLGVLLARKIRPRLAAAYVVAQIAGAIAGAAVLALILPHAIWGPVNLGTPGLAHGISPLAGTILEFILTFFLVFVVFGTAIDPRGPKLGGMAIGLAVTFGILLAGPLCGAALNPARALGPAVISGAFTYQWIWWVGPLLGGAAAAGVYQLISRGVSVARHEPEHATV